MRTINDAYQGFPIEIEAAIIENGMAKPDLRFSPIYLNKEQSSLFIKQLLSDPKAVRFIESTLMPLLQRPSGIKLISSYGKPDEFIRIFEGFENPMDDLLGTVKMWNSYNINEIYVHFTDKMQFH